LNILRADNTSGKSTALQSIIFALGLEGMLSPNRQVPLPHSMTDSVVVDDDEVAVSESLVRLEFANASGEIVTVARAAKSPSRNRNLISVQYGPAITAVGEYENREYYVRRQGAAQNEAGFHRFLADFLGLSLPRVSRHDGSESPLYLETIFPYFYVEQKHGWNGLQARMPSYLGIRDVARRSAEFVLGLEAFDVVLQKQRLASTLAELENEWQLKSQELHDNARAAVVVLQNPHRRISEGIAEHQSVPMLSIDGAWVAMAPAIERLTWQLTQMERDEVRSVGTVASELERSLAEKEASLQRNVAIAAGLRQEAAELGRQVQQLDERIAALEDDLRRHRDSEVLENYGAAHSHAMLADHRCPTCHQEVSDGADISTHAMSIAENIEFIRRQITVFRGSRADAARVAATIAARLESLASESRDLRSQIRAGRQTLVSATGAPAISEIESRLRLRQRLESLELYAGALESTRSELVGIAARWATQKAALRELDAQNGSENDDAKLRRVERSVRDQLRLYQFDSLNPEMVDIDRETYRPTNEGFDLGFDLSASDMIRLIWAYLLAFKEVGRVDGGHLDLLIFDEPRQQEAAHESYEALLQYTARRAQNGGQIVIATSEPEPSLLDMLTGATYHLINIPEGQRLLVPFG